ncbi:MAG: hypothetical protein KC800_08035 [Candidatus Eremiobacteraeota bacterium]|nr:hypothetical protein [Candidatus Eremiobacteraeota bacterium]
MLGVGVVSGVAEGVAMAGGSGEGSGGGGVAGMVMESVGTARGVELGVGEGSEGRQPASRVRANPAAVHRIAFMPRIYAPPGCFPPPLTG